MAKEQPKLRERIKSRLREPQRFKVVIHNDDFTTMDFVVMILVTIFFKTTTEAEKLMLDVHNKGQAVVGIYSFDIATSKVAKATRLARDNGYPLRLTIIPE